MSTRRQLREISIQTLYQYDARGEADIESIQQSVADGPYDKAIQQQALDIALKAWACHEQADALATELAPDWPTHRQPVVDRCLIRLAYYEMASRITPPAVAINEAIELAKIFSSKESPAFINGVLDKMAKHLRDTEQKVAPEPPQATPEQWLADAMRDKD